MCRILFHFLSTNFDFPINYKKLSTYITAITETSGFCFVCTDNPMQSDSEVLHENVHYPLV